MLSKIKGTTRQPLPGIRQTLGSVDAKKHRQVVQALDYIIALDDSSSDRIENNKKQLIYYQVLLI